MKKLKQWVKILTHSGHLNQQEAINELRWMAETIMLKNERNHKELHDVSKNNDGSWLSNNGNRHRCRGTIISIPNEETLKNYLQNRFSERQLAKLDRWVYERGIEHKPLQYILQTVDFCGLEFRVRKPVLIPRPETEEWCSYLANQISNMQMTAKKESLRILDLCSGSGCIGLSLLHLLRNCKKEPPYDVHVTLVDINPSALMLSRLNYRTLFPNNNLSRVRFIECDILNTPQEILISKLLSDEKEKFDVIVSNPPYIPKNEYAQLHESVKEWEDPRALIGPDGPYQIENSGCEFHDKIISLSSHLLVNHTQTDHETTIDSFPRVVLELNGEKQNKFIHKHIIPKYKHIDGSTIFTDCFDEQRAVFLYSSH